MCFCGGLNSLIILEHSSVFCIVILVKFMAYV